MMSHGGVDCMKLKAPKKEIVECLELLELNYEDNENDYMKRVISDFLKYIKESDKTVFSLDKMLKQKEVIINELY